MDDKVFQELLAKLNDRRMSADSGQERAEVAAAISVIEHMFEDEVAA